MIRRVQILCHPELLQAERARALWPLGNRHGFDSHGTHLLLELVLGTQCLLHPILEFHVPVVGKLIGRLVLHVRKTPLPCVLIHCFKEAWLLLWVFRSTGE